VSAINTGIYYTVQERAIIGGRPTFLKNPNFLFLSQVSRSNQKKSTKNDEHQEHDEHMKKI